MTTGGCTVLQYCTSGPHLAADARYEARHLGGLGGRRKSRAIPPWLTVDPRILTLSLAAMEGAEAPLQRGQSCTSLPSQETEKKAPNTKYVGLQGEVVPP